MTDFTYETNTIEELKQTILARIERKYPTKNRILKFLSLTTQKADQSLNQYVRALTIKLVSLACTLATGPLKTLKN